MLTIKGYRKAYNGVTVPTVPELTLSKGIFWIKGDNGSGKSTFFKSVAGIIPHEGTIDYLDINSIKQPTTYRKLVNYAEAEPSFPGFLTCKDLVRFVGKTRGASREQQDHFSKTFGIDQFFTKPCETFSSGMLKKLSLAIAFLGSPKIIILDEPLITLDLNARLVLNSVINEASQSGISFLISSHQLLDDLSLSVTDTFAINNKMLSRA